MAHRMFPVMALVFCLLGTVYSTSAAQTGITRGGSGNFPFLQKLEAKMGRSLTQEEKMKFLQETMKWKNGMTAAVETFARSLTDITGVPFEQTNAMMPKFGQMTEPYKKDVMPRLEEKLGRKLTQEETQKIMKAYQEKEKITGPLLQDYFQKLSSITGLPEETIKGILYMK
ncbi:MAG: hypothetical protein AB9903_11275 [Vulcanimicrobiota bacterium]